MDSTLFDRLALAWSGGSRRVALRTALGGATAATVGLLATAADSDAKKKKKCKKKTCKPTAGPGEPCTSNRDCCANETNLACAVGQSDTEGPTCCGAVGATCTLNPDCCEDLFCEDGTCQFVV